MVSGRVAGKVAIVTGGGTGIGRACAQLLAAEGARVVVAGRTPETGGETVRRIRAAGGEAGFVQADVSRAADVERMVGAAVEAYGRLDVLVNNAAIFPRATLAETTEEFWDRMLAVNLKGPYLCCRAAVPAMERGGGGSIINIGSIHGLGGAPELFAYAVSKGGLLTLTRNLAQALAPRQIRVNYVIPGWVPSEGELRVRAAQGQDLAWLEEQGRRLPMGRLQRPEDAAYAVLFLASDESSQVTGAVINTDGGAAYAMFGGRA